VHAFVRAGKPVLGVCGGMQALAGRIDDPSGREGNAAGLGLLPFSTIHAAHKIVRKSAIVVPVLDGFWKPLAERRLLGYEIRTGTVDGADPNSIQASVQARGNVLGIYLHGVFEDAEILAALFGGDERSPDPLEKAFEDLARLVGKHMDMKTISEWVQPSRLAGFC